MVSGRVDRTSATETVDPDSILGSVKVNQRSLKLVFTAFLLDVQQLKGLCEAPPCVVDRRADKTA